MSKGNRISQLRDTGIKVRVDNRHHKPIEDPGPGKHFWILTGLWRVANPTSNNFMLDAENLVTVDGPGCYKCEGLYTDELAAQPCKGSMFPL